MENEEKVEQTEETKKMTPTQVFWVKMTLFLLFSLVAPIIYLSVRYNLFQTTSKLQIGLWGIIVFGIMFAVIMVLIRFYLSGLKTKYSYGKQVLEGVIKLILPMGLALTIIVFLKDNMDAVIESIAVIMPCEFLAILVNPLPKWAFDNNVEGLAEISDKIFSRKDKGESK